MCGTPLGTSEPVPQPAGRSPAKRSEPAAEKTHPASSSLSGPSFLGLSGGDSRYGGSETSRDLNYLFEEEQPKRTYWRFALLMIILLAIGGLGWLEYSKNGKSWVAPWSSDAPKPPVQASQAPTPDQSAPSQTGPANPQAAAPAVSQPEAQTPQSPSKNAGPSEKDIPPSEEATSDTKSPARAEAPAESEGKQKDSAKLPSDAKSDTKNDKTSDANQDAAETDTATETKPAKFTRTPPKAKPATQAPAVSEDDALVANAEKYLYGRGVVQNCDRALSSLRAAAQRQNARARSLLGSMYATGHCVPRDLPNAYRWFALASRDNTDNMWVQRNLEMIWREMTPQERQLATQRNQ